MDYPTAGYCANKLHAAPCNNEDVMHSDLQDLRSTPREDFRRGDDEATLSGGKKVSGMNSSFILACSDPERQEGTSAETQ